MIRYDTEKFSNSDRVGLILQNLEEGFEKKLFKAAFKSLNDSNNPVRLNNFCTNIRELIRNVFKRLAPDKNVLKCVWYKNETKDEKGITRKQRAIYVVQGGLSSEYIIKTLGIDATDIYINLNKAINNLSKYTHISPISYNSPNNEVVKIYDSIIKTLSNLFFLIYECRGEIIDSLWEIIESSISYEMVNNSILALGESANHHYIEDVKTHLIGGLEITDKSLKIRAVGTIYCNLQLDSNSDIRKGKGHVIEKALPFECTFQSSVTKIEAIEIDEGSLFIEKKKWKKAFYGQGKDAFDPNSSKN